MTSIDWSTLQKKSLVEALVGKKLTSGTADWKGSWDWAGLSQVPSCCAGRETWQQSAAPDWALWLSEDSDIRVGRGGGERVNENELFDQHFPLLSFQNEKGELVDIVRTSLRMKKKKEDEITREQIPDWHQQGGRSSICSLSPSFLGWDRWACVSGTGSVGKQTLIWLWFSRYFIK